MCHTSVTDCEGVGGAVEVRGRSRSLSLAGDVVVLGRPLAEGVVRPPGVLVEAIPVAHHRTCSVHPVALALPLGTLAVVAVAPPPVTGQPVHREHVLGAGIALPVAVLCQVALVLLRPALLAAGRHLAPQVNMGTERHPS